MNDDELDELLRTMAPTPSARAQSTAVLVAREIRQPTRGVAALSGPKTRRRVVVAAAAAAALALAGAGTLAAYQLSIPPFQTLEKGVARSHSGIPFVYTNSLGRRVECLAFIEYENLDQQQRAAIEKLSKSRRWDGYGQRVLAKIAMPKASPEEQNAAIVDVIHQDLWQAAHEVVPSMVYMRVSDGPVYHGSSTSCAGPGGVDGRP